MGCCSSGTNGTWNDGDSTHRNEDKRSVNGGVCVCDGGGCALCDSVPGLCACCGCDGGGGGCGSCPSLPSLPSCDGGDGGGDFDFSLD